MHSMIVLLERYHINHFPSFGEKDSKTEASASLFDIPLNTLICELRGHEDLFQILHRVTEMMGLELEHV